MCTHVWTKEENKMSRLCDEWRGEKGFDLLAYRLRLQENWQSVQSYYERDLSCLLLSSVINGKY